MYLAVQILYFSRSNISGQWIYNELLHVLVSVDISYWSVPNHPMFSMEFSDVPRN